MACIDLHHGQDSTPRLQMMLTVTVDPPREQKHSKGASHVSVERRGEACIREGREDQGQAIRDREADS